MGANDAGARDDTPGTVRGTLLYVGGQPWWVRYGEYGLIVGGLVAIVVVFVVDARRRRRSRAVVEERAGELDG